MHGNPNRKSNLLLVIPAYNEEGNLEEVVNNIVTNYSNYDYVIVNDGSTDATRKICINNAYNYVDYPVNQGLTSAFRGGVYYALQNEYEFILQFDGDGQHNPKYIHRILKTALDSKADIVIGSRFIGREKNFSMRMIGSRILEACIFLTTGTEIKDPTSGMRLFSRRAMKLLYNQKDFGPEPDAVAHLIRSGMKVIEVPVEMRERVTGESYLNVTNSIQYMLHLCFSILVAEFLRKQEY